MEQSINETPQQEKKTWVTPDMEPISILAKIATLLESSSGTQS